MTCGAEEAARVSSLMEAVPAGFFLALPARLELAEPDDAGTVAPTLVEPRDVVLTLKARVIVDDFEATTGAGLLAVDPPRRTKMARLEAAVGGDKKPVPAETRRECDLAGLPVAEAAAAVVAVVVVVEVAEGRRPVSSAGFCFLVEPARLRGGDEVDTEGFGWCTRARCTDDVGAVAAEDAAGGDAAAAEERR
jgi:hypothetical protein